MLMENLSCNDNNQRTETRNATLVKQSMHNGQHQSIYVLGLPFCLLVCAHEFSSVFLWSNTESIEISNSYISSATWKKDLRTVQLEHSRYMNNAHKSSQRTKSSTQIHNTRVRLKTFRCLKKVANKEKKGEREMGKSWPLNASKCSNKSLCNSLKNENHKIQLTDWWECAFDCAA